MISIIMSVYNTRIEWVTKAVDSVLNQTCGNWELLIIDDGSEETIAAGLDKLKYSDCRIKVFHQENQGLSVARNLGMDNANGEYIAFLDADDWIEADYVETLQKYLDAEKPDLLAFAHADHRAETIEPKLHDTPYFTTYSAEEKKNMHLVILHADAMESRYTMFFGAQWNIIYRRELLNKYNIRNTPGLLKAQDSVFNLYAIEHAEKICYLNKVLYHYIINDESVTHRYKAGYKHITKLLMERRKFINEFHPQDKDYIETYDYGSIIVFDGLCGLNFFHPNNPNPMKERKIEMIEMLESEPYSTILGEIQIDTLTAYKKIQLTAMRHKAWPILRLLYEMKRVKHKG